MNENLLRKKIAKLEFEQDQLLAELKYIDTLLKNIGFSNGLATIKDVALEMIDSEKKMKRKI